MWGGGGGGGGGGHDTEVELFHVLMTDHLCVSIPLWYTFTQSVSTGCTALYVIVGLEKLLAHLLSWFHSNKRLLSNSSHYSIRSLSSHFSVHVMCRIWSSCHKYMHITLLSIGRFC